MDERSELLEKMVHMLYPLIMLFGVYIILNGHITPGGGFHGGAIISAIFISRYIISPTESVNDKIMQTAEKFIYILIVAIPVMFLFTGFNRIFTDLNELYLVTINIFIGIKVFCGLGIVFLRFAFYEVN
jgi:multicomponent Na+:H+ antiporter subunit B